MAAVLEALEGCGYAVSHRLINSRALTPQNRKRLYLVGFRRAHAPAATERQPPAADPANGAHAGRGGSGPGSREFAWPWLPDLQLRLSHVLEPAVGACTPPAAGSGPQPVDR